MLKKCLLFITLCGVAAINAVAQSDINRDPNMAKLVTSDIDLFWNAYDKATPANDLIVYRDEYLKKGSPGLESFTKLRVGSSCGLLNAITAAPKYYAGLRQPSLKVASYEPRIRASYKKLQEIYPDAVFPDVYFMVGRMTSAGTLTENVLLIGVDMFGKRDEKSLEELGAWHKAVVGSIDRLPFIVAHELIHYQQKYPQSGNQTLLARSINEGSADFIAELIAGSHINPHLHTYGNPLEKELWLEFQKEMNGTDVSNWLYQGDAAKIRPADLGYYMGYKIAESYYKKATDKKQAIRDILEIRDFRTFLGASGYPNKFY